MNLFLGCAKCHIKSVPLIIRCQVCRRDRYCSEKCQKTDELNHKTKCMSEKDARKEESSKPAESAEGQHTKGHANDCPCCPHKHTESLMRPISDEEAEMTRKAMSEFLGTKWSLLFNLFLLKNPVIEIKSGDGKMVYIDCTNSRFLKSPPNKPGVIPKNSGIFLLDWASKKFSFIPNTKETKEVMTCMTASMKPKFNEEVGLWVQVWMDKSDPTCAEPWWNFGWKVGLLPSTLNDDGTLTPNLSFVLY